MVAETGLNGQTAVITGASSGIGRCIALELARRGMHLCLIGRDNAALQALAEETDSVTVSIFQADFANEDQIGALRQRLETEVPCVDVLVHSAGAYSMGAFSQ